MGENVPRELGGKRDAPEIQLPGHLQLPSDGWTSRIESWRPRDIAIGSEGHQELVSLPAGGTVSWQWALIAGTITFEVSVISNCGEELIVVPRKEWTFSDCEEPVHGELSRQDLIGKLRFVWQNGTGRFKPKTLLLRLEVI